MCGSLFPIPALQLACVPIPTSVCGIESNGQSPSISALEMLALFRFPEHANALPTCSRSQKKKGIAKRRAGARYCRLTDTKYPPLSRRVSTLKWCAAAHGCKRCSSQCHHCFWVGSRCVCHQAHHLGKRVTRRHPPILANVIVLALLLGFPVRKLVTAALLDQRHS